VLAYLSRYTHRVAISKTRLIADAGRAPSHLVASGRHLKPFTRAAEATALSMSALAVCSPEAAGPLPANLDPG
jgi:hypothetical protein